VPNGHPNLRRKQKALSGLELGRLGGNSGSWGEGGKCQDWYTFGKLGERVPNLVEIYAVVSTVTLSSCSMAAWEWMHMIRQSHRQLAQVRPCCFRDTDSQTDMFWSRLNVGRKLLPMFFSINMFLWLYSLMVYVCVCLCYFSIAYLFTYFVLNSFYTILILQHKSLIDMCK